MYAEKPQGYLDFAHLQDPKPQGLENQVYYSELSIIMSINLLIVD